MEKRLLVYTERIVNVKMVKYQITFDLELENCMEITEKMKKDTLERISYGLFEGLSNRVSNIKIIVKD